MTVISRHLGSRGLKQAKKELLAPQNLRANCLCTKHNSALHPLDDAAKFFFTSLKSFLETDTGSRHAIVSGHDIERWLLKTAKAAAVSKSFARGRERLSGAFSRDTAILEMLDSPSNWPDGVGLYCVMNTGDIAVNHRRFQFQPLTNKHDDIEALGLNILELRFALLLEPPDASNTREGTYRPARIVISYPSSTNWITMSWDDGKPHDSLTMQFVQPIGSLSSP